jgi:hypothetical protein
VALSREAGSGRWEAGSDSRFARIALLLSLALAWLNFLLTSRWAAIPGSVHGPKRLYYLAALVVASVLAFGLKGERVRLGRIPAAILAGGCLFLFTCFMFWFPPSTWTRIPFLDDWPPRFQSTVEGVRLLRDAAFSGWRWEFLGGYPIATDVTQDLTAWAALPMLLFGSEAGFHVAHLVLFAAIPALVWWDVRLDGSDDADVASLSAGLAAIFSANYSYFLIRSGDTNSLTGAVAALATLVAARAARAGVRGASVALVGALTLTNYSHRGFFLYALLFLALDAAVAWDRRSLRRAAIATAAALVGGLPVTWDLWRYPQYFIANNVSLHPAPFELAGFLRKVYYNTELLLLPGRWFNDFTGLTNVFLPVVVFTAWRARGRARFYAAATIGVVCLVRLIYDSFGYVFLRPIIFLPMFIAPPLAWFILRRAGRRGLALALVALVSLYIQVWFGPVPHVRSVRDFDPALVDRLAGLDGDLVLVENAFHRDVDVSPATTSVPTPFPAHFEALLPAATGTRLYAGMWDGWQWTPYRDQVFANGTFRGRALRDVPVAELERELHKWGIQHLLVWSDPATQYLGAAGQFRLRGRFGRWSDYEYAGPRLGAPGTLVHRDSFGGIVRVIGAERGQVVTVRTNFHPAWRAHAEGRPVTLFNAEGQLAFAAPRGGDIEVGLVYPRRLWLLPVAVGGLLLGAIGMRMFT